MGVAHRVSDILSYQQEHLTGVIRLRVTFLLSHQPNPRMYKRMMALSSEHEVCVVYWDRRITTAASFSVPPDIVCIPIEVNAPLGRLWLRLVPLLRFAARSVSVIRSIEPDVIHCGGLDMLWVGWLYQHSGRGETRLVYEVADLRSVTFGRSSNPIKKAIRGLASMMEWYLLRSVSFMIITSPHFWSAYYRGHFSEEEVLFLPNAPMRSQFDGYESQPHECFTVGAIGSVRYPEQLKMLVDVAESMPGISVLIAGDGPDYDEIREYCIGKQHVSFHGPYNYQRDIVGLYSRIDCVYSVYDTSLENVRVALPNRLYEAIVCQLPVIAAAGTELGDFVESQRIGFSVSDREPEGLREAIRRMASDAECLGCIKRRLSAIRSDYYGDEASQKLLAKYSKP